MLASIVGRRAAAWRPGAGRLFITTNPHSRRFFVRVGSWQGVLSGGPTPSRSPDSPRSSASARLIVLLPQIDQFVSHLVVGKLSGKLTQMLGSLPGFFGIPVFRYP